MYLRGYDLMMLEEALPKTHYQASCWRPSGSFEHDYFLLWRSPWTLSGSEPNPETDGYQQEG